MQSYAELSTLILLHVSNLFSNVTSEVIPSLTQIAHWIFLHKIQGKIRGDDMDINVKKKTNCFYHFTPYPSTTVRCSRGVRHCIVEGYDSRTILCSSAHSSTPIVPLAHKSNSFNSSKVKLAKVEWMVFSSLSMKGHSPNSYSVSFAPSCPCSAAFVNQ